MGWLIEETRARGKTKLSLQALAARMWKEKDCPRELKTESLANNLRKLDKGEMVDWWLGAGRRYLPILAAVLPMDLAELEADIQGARSVEDDPDRWFHFEVFPRLRPIDLDEEPPYPGVPRELVEGDGPTRRTWWRAPPGCGRTLVGRWLARRHGWTFGSATERSFMEVDHAPNSRPSSYRIVLASPNRMPTLWANDGWTEVVTPKDWAIDLLNWVCDRLEPGGRFEREAVATWLAKAGDRAETPGRLLELLALVDLVGPLALDGELAPETILAAWVAQHAARQDRAVAPASRAFLRDQGAWLLPRLELSRIMERRTFAEEQVLRCFPAIRPPPDADAVLEANKRGPRAVEELVSPQPVALLEAMKALRWLLPDSWGFPSHVQRQINACIVDLATKGPLTTMGALLDRDELVEPTLSAMAERPRIDRYLSVVTSLDLDDPAAALAIDGLCKAVTLCLARGESLAPATVAPLWKVRVKLAGDGPYPDLPLHVRSGEPVVEKAWSALSILVLAPDGAPRWQVAAMTDFLVQRREDLPDSLAPLRRYAAEVLADLFSRHEPPADAHIVAADLHTLLERNRELSAHRMNVLAGIGPPAFVSLLLARGGWSWEDFARALWPTWLEHFGPFPWGRPGSDELATVSMIWELVPLDAIKPAHLRGILQQAARGVELRREVWRKLIRVADGAMLAEVAGLAPLEILGELIQAPEDGPAGCASVAMWARAPRTQHEQLSRALRTRDDGRQLRLLLDNVPGDEIAAALGQMVGSPVIELPASTAQVLGRWLEGVMDRDRHNAHQAYRVWRAVGRSRDG